MGQNRESRVLNNVGPVLLLEKIVEKMEGLYLQRVLEEEDSLHPSWPYLIS